jgi:exodeoxyribonuclease VII large subunit
MPAIVGVVTSRDGAALQDFLRTRSLRWPLYPVRLAHTSVQGAGAAEEIAAAIRRLDATGVDVIVVCRGGGSLEDLWAFNERAVAEAIRAASVPVVTGVGHETDVTLADLVADHRAHTPTDAAQTVIPDRRAMLADFERARNHLLQAIDGALDRREQRLARASASPALKSPGLDPRPPLRRPRAPRALAAPRRRIAHRPRRLAPRARRHPPRAPEPPPCASSAATPESPPSPPRLARAVAAPLESASAASTSPRASLEAISPLRVLRPRVLDHAAGRGEGTARRRRDAPARGGDPHDPRLRFRPLARRRDRCRGPLRPSRSRAQ